MPPASPVKAQANTSIAHTPVAQHLFFGLLIIAGVILRCLWLDKESLWLDELYSWWFSDDLGRALRAEVANPPLYYTLVHFWRGFFGSSEIAMRALSVMASIAALFTTWRIALSLVPAKIALLAVVYQSISTFHIFYAQEARTHALLLLVLSVGFLVVLKITDSESPGRIRWLLLYAVLMTGALYMHFVASFYMIMHAAFVLIVCRKSIRTIMKYAAAAGTATLLFSPWLIQMMRAANEGQIRRYLFLKVPQTYFSLLFGDTLVPLDESAVRNIRQTLAEYGFVLIAAIFVTAVIAAFALRALSGYPLRSKAAIGLLGAGPVALSLAVSLAGVPMFDERYVLSSTPFVYIAVALGLSELWARRRQDTRMRVGAYAVVSLYAALLAASIFNYYGNPRFGKEQWREVVSYIERETPQGSQALLVFEPDYLRVAQEYYGRKAMPRVLVTGGVKKALLAAPGDISAMGHRADVVWLIRAHERDDMLLKAFQSRMQEKGHAVFPKAKGVNVYRFEGLPEAAVTQ